MEKKSEKAKHDSKSRDDGAELENQLILRLPEEAATTLHEALQTGNLKDRMTIKMDFDLRYGEVRFDHWLLHAKIVDLPTVIECLKTIDNKSFYKSADICQLMICKEDADALDSEKESPAKGKKKDPNKVDKKYLWPHGVTPPCKNVRKRRFRKTLKKKNVEAPEIEKEVKRLLRVDNEAVKVEYEIISEEAEKQALEQQHARAYNDGEDEETRQTRPTRDKTSSPQKDINVESDGDDEDEGPSVASAAIGGVGEHDIFGEEVSSSDDDDEDERRRMSRMRDVDDISRLSADDSRSYSFSQGGSATGTARAGAFGDTKNEPTEFNKSMFGGSKADNDADGMGSSRKFDAGSSSNLAAPSGYFDVRKRDAYDEDVSMETVPQMSAEQAKIKIIELRRQYDDLRLQQQQKAQEIATIQNPTLRQRMQETLDNLLSQMIEKELEMKDFENVIEEQKLKL